MSQTSTANKTKPAQRYIWQEKLGEGACGMVYAAYDQHEDKRVAVKVPLTHDLHATRELFKEAELMEQLSIPGVIPVFDIGMLSDGRGYYTMPILEGQTLEDILVSRAMDKQRGLEVIERVAEILQSVHRQGVVHCDLKPANIFLTNDNQVFLIDWGTAERFISLEGTQVKNSPSLKGTPLYLAPEVIGGEVARPQSDLYALGVILYEMWTGECPFFDDDIRTLFYKAYVEEPLPPSQRNGYWEDDEMLEEVILVLLNKKPVHRYSSAAALKQTLSTLHRDPNPLGLPSWFAPPVGAETYRRAA